MKITATKKDDILRRKAEYEAKKSAYEDAHHERDLQRRQDEQNILEPIQRDLEQHLANYSALTFDVSVSRGWRLETEDGTSGLEIRIRCNDRNHFDDNSALSWTYEAKIDAKRDQDGSIEYVPIRETSSWSGLKAVTDAQMKSLRQTVSALEFLNDYDWDSVLTRKFKPYNEYYSDLPENPGREDFTKELDEATIEELIGTNKFIKVNPFESSGYRSYVWIHPVRQTAAQYEVVVLPNSAVTRPDELQYYSNSFKYTRRVRKTSISPVRPYEIQEVNMP